MQQYLDVIASLLKDGERTTNRGDDVIFNHGLYMKFPMSEGFPAVTTKTLNYKSCFAEMLGFWRGYSNSDSFAGLGSKVWSANANAWNSSIFSNSNGDLGRIYGVQARDWLSPGNKPVDQLRQVHNKLQDNEDDRRLIVTHWNPGELHQMALPPCHLFYQFGLRNLEDPQHMRPTLDLFVYIRSNDVGLGMPFNIAGYAWLLEVMSRLTNKNPGTLHYFAFNYHMYVNHKEALETQLQRTPKELPLFGMNPYIETMTDMDTHATVDDFYLIDYEPHPAIKMPMTVRPAATK